MDQLLAAVGGALKTLFAKSDATRPYSNSALKKTQLTAQERALAARLMRVNHVGEICAQALYTAQASVTHNPTLRLHFKQAAAEETDHLAWTATRLVELDSRPSLLNPLWYAGAFGVGLLAGSLGDRVSLGFVVETEKQVEAHLAGHLKQLPINDCTSRAIIEQMKIDEARHGAQALQVGAVELPRPTKGLMRAAAKVMTTVARYV